VTPREQRRVQEQYRRAVAETDAAMDAWAREIAATHPAPEKITVQEWNVFAGRKIDTPAWRCVVCRSVWLDSSPPDHHADCTATRNRRGES
jgi:hypothetical protein